MNSAFFDHAVGNRRRRPRGADRLLRTASAVAAAHSRVDGGEPDRLLFGRRRRAAASSSRRCPPARRAVSRGAQAHLAQV